MLNELQRINGGVVVKSHSLLLINVVTIDMQVVRIFYFDHEIYAINNGQLYDPPIMY